MKWLVIGLLVIGVLIARRGGGVTAGGSEIDAYTMAKQFVTERLKAPRTAHFPSIVDDQVQVESLGGGRWRVRAFVDAENSFGGEVRTVYKCVLRTENGEKWFPEVVELYQ